MENTNPSSLEALAKSVSEPIPCEGNLPLDLSDAGYLWLIETGAADVFIVEHLNGVAQAAPQHLLRAESGRILPGIKPNLGPTEISLIAKGVPGTVLRRIPIEKLAGHYGSELANQIDLWLVDFSASLSRFDSSIVRADLYVANNETQAADSGVISTLRGVAWVSGIESGNALYQGLIELVADDVEGDLESLEIPLTRNSWIYLSEQQQLLVQSSDVLEQKGILLPALARFHEVALSMERINRGLNIADEVNFEREKITKRQTDENFSRRSLFDLYDQLEDSADSADEQALFGAMRIIGRHEGIQFVFPKRRYSEKFSTLFTYILHASGVRARRVRLNHKDKWWSNFTQPLLAFRREDGQPVVLLRNRLGRCELVDHVSGHTVTVTPENAETLSDEAWLFYNPLPTDQPSSLKELGQFAFKGLGSEFARLAVTGFATSAIMLLPAVILGIVVDEVLTQREPGLIYMAGGVMVVVAVLAALLKMLNGFALTRLEFRAVTRAELAFWDRLMRLPRRFFQNFSTGELAMRSLVFQAFRDAAQEAFLFAISSIFLLLAGSVIAIWHDPLIGAVATVLATASLAGTLWLCMGQITSHRIMTKTMHSLAGLLFQLINGISTLRLAGAEGSAFAVWANGYRSQKRAELKHNSATERVRAFCATMLLVGGVVLILTALLIGGDSVEVGDFLVIVIFFVIFQGEVARFGKSFDTISTVILSADRIVPFLAQSPEAHRSGDLVEVLTGDILVDRVSFRYDPDGPLILKEVSIRTTPGEFIAITGKSGSGKSTLFNLLLNIDSPSSGAIYYDGRDLKLLNPKQVRRNIGAIPQTVRLHPDDVWDNITCGREDVSGKEAWEAARKAVVDREISAMPMKMMTYVGGDVLSGGESQRITISRALLDNARILIMDEATNWLDNQSQDQVMEIIAGLNMTRIVIAHRLSTLHQADRIYVLDDGQVVEQGNFSELMESEGHFYDLVRRQMI